MKGAHLAKVAEFAIIGSQGIEAAAPPCRQAASPSHRRATIVPWRRMVRAGRRGSTKLSPSQSFYPIFLAAEKWTDRLTNHAILKLATFPDFVYFVCYLDNDLCAGVLVFDCQGLTSFSCIVHLYPDLELWT